MECQNSSDQKAIVTTDATNYSIASTSSHPLSTSNSISQLESYIDELVTQRPAAEYNTRNEFRGEALIFNHENFDKLLKRDGTNLDCDKLEQVLNNLDFNVTVYKDYCYDDILSTVKGVAKQNHKHNDCIVVTILSHGEMGTISARDVEYDLDSICSYFTADKCPDLAGKPKLFFIQACQGARFDEGTTMQSGPIETDGSSTKSYKIPIHADFLIAYSTIPGFYSWRNTKHGSWFMTSLCEGLAAYGKRLDMLSLLTLVCQSVAVKYETPYTDQKRSKTYQVKQMPCITSMLTRLLRFSDTKKKHTT